MTKETDNEKLNEISVKVGKVAEPDTVASNDNNYVDRHKLTRDMVKYVEGCNRIKNMHPDKKPSELLIDFPHPSDYVCESVLLICKNTSMRYNFYKYTWREEMVGEAVLHCMLYMHNYTEFCIDRNTGQEKKSCAFNYITSIATRCFGKIIKSENKKVADRYKAIQNGGIIDLVEDLGVDGEEHGTEFMENLRTFMEDVDGYKKVAESMVEDDDQPRKRRKKQIDKDQSIDGLIY